MEKRKESVTMNKEKQLYNYIKSTFIDEHIKKDYEEKNKNTKQILRLCKEEYGFDDEVVIKIFKIDSIIKNGRKIELDIKLRAITHSPVVLIGK